MGYLAGLVLTLAVEVPVVVLAGRWLGTRAARTAAVALLASLVTHPLLWFVVAPVLDARLGLGGIVVAELLVVAAEAVVYDRCLCPPIGGAAAFWLSLLANAVSFLAGVVLLW
jgi:hypothetical protein